MKIMYERTVSHGQGLEVPMAALSFIVGLII